MIICNECFVDTEIISIIKSLKNRGKCHTCGRSNVFLYDTDNNYELTNIFNDLLSIYYTLDSLPNDYPKSDLHLLKDEFLTNWKIFNNIRSEHVYNILTSLSQDMYLETPYMFDSPVGNKYKYDKEYLHEHSILRTNQWDDFVNALKYENRFHTNHVNTLMLEYFCSNIEKKYHAGTIFYRGRISPESGYSIDDMGAPPKEIASEGRANSAGISRLYLANDIDTTIHEVRAGVFDIITVGKFELKSDITVVDLKMIDRISPFNDRLDCLKFAINKEHLNKIDYEMGKALRRSDSHLDYIPTQFISDFIKSINNGVEFKYSGIEYKSTMKPDGYNLSIFDPNLFNCVEVTTYKIDELTYKKSAV